MSAKSKAYVSLDSFPSLADVVREQIMGLVRAKIGEVSVQSYVASIHLGRDRADELILSHDEAQDHIAHLAQLGWQGRAEPIG